MTMEPKITLYKEPNFAGDFKVLSEGCEKLVDVGFPDGASSVKVESGVWILYKNEDYKGDICVVIDKGQETKCSISSLKPLENAEVDLSVHPKCTIYQHHFTGRSSTHTQDASNLGNLNNDASSIRVQSGAWVAYEDGNFGGKQTLFLRGYHKHDTFAKWYPGYGKFPNDRFSSIKALPIKIKIKKQPKISLYKDPNHTDTLKTFTTASDNLDKSVLIESGVWILYDHVNYEGDINVVMEGDKLTDFKYSSIKPLKYDFTEDPKCTIFEHDLDVGEDHTLTEEVQNLEKKHMTDVSSIRVHSGAWVSYEGADFKGKQTLFLRGDHEASTFQQKNPGYGKFTNDKFVSLKAVQIKPKLPMITLYDQPDFMGVSETYTKKQEALKVASSVIVESGVWVLEPTEKFPGDICVMMEGDRINFVQYNKNEKFHDFKSSKFAIKPLEYDFSEEPKCTIYEHHFVGKSLELKANTPDLRHKNMNDIVSSIIVHSGAWIGFEAVNFRSFQTLYLPGKHVLSSTEGKFRNDTLSSLRAIQIVPPVMPVIVDKIEFHLDQRKHKETPVTVFSWRQKNNTNTDQKLSITKDKSIRREDTYEFRWNQGTRVSLNVSHKLSVPKPAFGFKGGPETTISLGVETWYDIGSTKGNKTAKEETWKVHYPTSIAPKTELTLTSTITESNLDVPFTASLHQGDKKWEETGTYFGVQYFGFVTEFDEKFV
ncbi:very large A-kinase anchor protein-like isoform X1 [Mytilus californianus]|uniref:very large A-kinase anchor protein-like isoform X1 n=1 Tax=Mytilus californianus TaxID=6549 RepID=UPI0022482664|nr:very large A-kinase anchor protein-like isoform X1 [Mytilus californianus]